MKYISILGDSISTFEGYNPNGYDVYYDFVLQHNNGITSINDTWWMKVIQHMNGSMLVNASFSGSKVTGQFFPSANHPKRIQDLSTKEHKPDIILIYIGFNDFGYGIQTRKKPFSRDSVDIFECAYNMMLRGINREYPLAVVVCGTLMKTTLKTDPTWIFPNHYQGHDINEYNEIIKKACSKNKCILAYLANTNLCYETLDTSHATVDGHNTIAQAWIKCLNELSLL